MKAIHKDRSDGGNMPKRLEVGQTAPDFRLPCHLGGEVQLSSLRGQNVVIAFFPMAWTPI
jgi:peroxiredoxin Q/BCP